MKTKQTLGLLSAIFFAVFVYMLPTPDAVTPEAWKLFAVFLGTITLIVIDAFPMGAASLMGLTAALLTHSLTFEEAFRGFTSHITWLILSAFFISHGLVHTGLGKRIALLFIAACGKSSLGLAYGVGLAEITLAPGTPSSTARTGGIIFPVVDAISRSFDSLPHSPSRNRIGKFLTLCLFQFTVVSSAMFMTAMAANPFAVKLAKMAGIDITWGSWALYALVPGIASIILGPLVLLKIAKPEITDTKSATHHAKKELKEIGPMKTREKLMALTFIVLIALWILGPIIGISATAAALFGLSLLLILDICTWEQLLKLSGAFETFIWFGALLGLAEALTESGFTEWFGQTVAASLSTFNMPLAVTLLFLIYFYAHYFFASCTAHVGALFLPFVKGAIALGAAAAPTAFAFSYASSLFGSLTHYGIGPAPILFGSGYVEIKEWWRAGFILSVTNLAIWTVFGGAWWWVLGMF